MKSAVVIVAWNGERYLRECLDSVLGQTVAPGLVVVVDNASDDSSAELARSYESAAQDRGTSLRVMAQSENTGFSRGANTGLRMCLTDSPAPDTVILLNQDATLDATWCERISEVFGARPRVGAVGSKIFYPNRLTIQHAGGYIERPRLVGRHYGHHDTGSVEFDQLRDVEFVTAAAIALRAEALREAGVFDEIYSPGYYEDVDLCERLRARGWDVVYCPDAIATHVESASFAERAERLHLGHRNRLIYALPQLADDAFRETFRHAERQYLRDHALPDECRALAAACLSVMLMLPEALQARIPSATDHALAIALIALLADLRGAALA